MNWLTDYVRPKIKALVRSNRPEVPENLWVHCPSCEHMIFHRDLESSQPRLVKCAKQSAGKTTARAARSATPT